MKSLFSSDFLHASAMRNDFQCLVPSRNLASSFLQYGTILLSHASRAPHQSSCLHARSDWHLMLVWKVANDGMSLGLSEIMTWLH